MINNRIFVIEIAVFTFVIVAVCGCGPRATNASVAGTYQGTYFGVIENLDLRLDGTFSQKLTYSTGEEYLRNGKWRLDYKLVELENYLNFLGDSYPPKVILPPRGVSYDSYIWNASNLVKDWEAGKYILEQIDN